MPTEKLGLRHVPSIFHLLHKICTHVRVQAAQLAGCAHQSQAQLSFVEKSCKAMGCDYGVCSGN